MKLYVGLDVSLATTAICVIDEHGRRVKMTAAASDPQAIATALRRHAKGDPDVRQRSRAITTQRRRN
jgi:hypothetical protein